MDFIDRLLRPGARLLLERAIDALCAAIFFFGAWLVWLKADRIWEYRDATDVLRIVYELAARAPGPATSPYSSRSALSQTTRRRRRRSRRRGRRSRIAAGGTGPEQPVDEVHHDVLVGGDERQAAKMRTRSPSSVTSTAPDRPLKTYTEGRVDERERRHRRQDRRGGDPRAPRRSGAPNDARGRPAPRSTRGSGARPLAHLPAATCFSSAPRRGPWPRQCPWRCAFLIQSSMIGAERLCSSPTNAGSALTTGTPAFFNPSRPARSACVPRLAGEQGEVLVAEFDRRLVLLGQLVHLPWFMKNPNAELYIPPGRASPAR